MRIVNWIVFLACVALTGGPISAAEEMKIAVVDMDVLLKAHPNTKLAEYHFMKQREEYEGEQKEMLAELETLRKTYEEAARDAENKALSEEERNKRKEIAKEKRTAVSDMERKIVDTTMKRQKQLNEDRIRQQREIIGDIRRVVRGYAEKKGFDYIFDNAAVVYSKNMEKSDMTLEVRKLLEEEKPAKE